MTTFKRANPPIHPTVVFIGDNNSHSSIRRILELCSRAHKKMPKTHEIKALRAEIALI